MAISTNTDRVTVSKKTNLAFKYGFDMATMSPSLIGLEIASIVCNGFDLHVNGYYPLNNFRAKPVSDVIGEFEIYIDKAQSAVLMFTDKQIGLLTNRSS